jgi:hypothetical protein
VVSTEWIFDEKGENGMKKLALLVGLGAGFVAGSWAGRAPYERLETMVRNALKQPKVQRTLHSAADGAATARDAALDAATGAIDEASKAATDAIDEATKRVATGTQKVASKAGNGS